MLIVGLTGGLASGKSLVADLLRRHGAVVFSADEAARAVLAPDGPVLPQIISTFGAEVLTPNGSLDRAELGRRVFADEEERERLNRITHPPILRLLIAQMEAVRADLAPSTIAVFEVPLLFEAKMQDWFERIVVVSASKSTQISRLRTRSHLDAAEAERRVAAQLPIEAKSAQADYIVQNDGSLSGLLVEVDNLWRWLTNSHLRSEREQKNTCVLRPVML